MRKHLSILMLFVVLIVGAHPTLAMHFCGEKLRSVAVVSESDYHKACCSQRSTTEISDEANTSGSCISKTNTCCLTKTVEISTDTYKQHERQFNVPNILPSFDNVWLTLNYLSNQVTADDSTEVLEYFPPDGLNVEHVDILALICTYRI